MLDHAVSEAGVQEAPQLGGPCAMVIFGASGDLAKRFVVTALSKLVENHL
jgi:glucose-6-phosphate 1-dehydrogenase